MKVENMDLFLLFGLCSDVAANALEWWYEKEVSNTSLIIWNTTIFRPPNCIGCAEAYAID